MLLTVWKDGLWLATTSEGRRIGAGTWKRDARTCVIVAHAESGVRPSALDKRRDELLCRAVVALAQAGVTT